MGNFKNLTGNFRSCRNVDERTLCKLFVYIEGYRIEMHDAPITLHHTVEGNTHLSDEHAFKPANAVDFRDIKLQCVTPQLLCIRMDL